MLTGDSDTNWPSNVRHASNVSGHLIMFVPVYYLLLFIFVIVYTRFQSSVNIGSQLSKEVREQAVS